MTKPNLGQKQPAPTKGRIVRYHDPISGEVLAAIVAKVHTPDNPDSKVNLSYFTEEGLVGAACDVPAADPARPGEFGRWSWPEY